MNFKEMLLQAKAGRESAVMALLEMYKPLLVKYAKMYVVKGESEISPNTT